MDHRSGGCYCSQAADQVQHMERLGRMQKANDDDVKKALGIVRDMEKIVKALHAENCKLRGVEPIEVEVLV